MTVAMLPAPYGPRTVANIMVQIFDRAAVPTEALFKIPPFWEEALYIGGVYVWGL